MPLEIIQCEQGTEEWLHARLGIPTASMFGTVMAQGRGGGESKTRRTYMLKLLGERMTGELAGGFSNRHTERGHEMEPDARDAYAFMTDNEPELVGFMRNGDKGASPDFVVSADGLGEIKSKEPHLQLAVLDAEKVPAEHIPQIQGQIWVAEREWCDFVSYWPKLPLFVKRVYRDDLYIKKLAEAVDRFNDEMKELHETIKRRYAA